MTDDEWLATALRACVRWIGDGGLRLGFDAVILEAWSDGHGRLNFIYVPAESSRSYVIGLTRTLNSPSFHELAGPLGSPVDATEYGLTLALNDLATPVVFETERHSFDPIGGVRW
ncbi:hypothetical protein [Curtobacterium sp. 9128]|uniref:hypothetical protein n=1 Tax=Curtobacterium sp. 9128 TaxID=1793722 RepID=UPI00119D6CB2|nr:hypothetical protein [Curtobacterium sp. 9128]